MRLHTFYVKHVLHIKHLFNILYRNTYGKTVFLSAKTGFVNVIM